MLKLHSCKGKKVGVFGLSRTGISVCRSLAGIANLIVYDDSIDKLNLFLAEEINPSDYCIVDITSDEWQSCDFIVLSPGIPLRYPHPHPIVQLASKYRIPIKSDIDLLYNELPTRKYIGVTGTNGKSTTSSLIWHILNSTGSNFALGGNIGNAVLSLDNDVEGYVIELSSFHLDMISDLQLDIAILLNITPDHIDRHGSFEEYKRAKHHIFSLVKSGGYALINNDSTAIKDTYKQQSCLKVNSGKEILNIMKADNINKRTIVLSRSLFNDLDLNCSLIGDHNRQNITAAVTACKILNKKDNDIIHSVKCFVPLRHRMQFIAEKDKISFYNDSKATNSVAAHQALSSLSNIYWLTGGVSKDGGIEPILDIVSYSVTKAYLYGQSKYDFALALNGKVPYSIHENMEDAFRQATIDAINNRNISKNILLSPACASYDQFVSYEARGDKFIELVHRFIQNDNV